MYKLPPLTDGTILKRYKRFLADIELSDGRTVTAHCPNTGAMTTCWEPGAPAQLSHSDNPKRKLPWTLERVNMGRGWIGVNTSRVNHIVASAIAGGYISQLGGYSQMQREPVFKVPGYPNSRFDILLSDGPDHDAYVEVKNTTLVHGEVISFPDAVTERGRKHLELLAEAIKLGFRGVIVYALNRPEGRYFEPAQEIDPKYAQTLERVANLGVEIVIARLRHVHDGVTVSGSTSPPGVCRT